MNVLMKSNFPMKSPNLTASSQNTSLTASFKKNESRSSLPQEKDLQRLRTDDERTVRIQEDSRKAIYLSALSLAIFAALRISKPLH